MKQNKKVTYSLLLEFILAQRYWVLGFVISAVAVVVLSSTLLADAIYFKDPRHQDVAFEAWMTPRYVAHSYDLPRPLIRELFRIESGTEGPVRLDRVAQNLGVTLEELTETVRDSAAAYRRSQADD